MSEPQKICPQCQLQQPLSAAFCPGCGRQFRTTAPHQPMPEKTIVVSTPAPKMPGEYMPPGMVPPPASAYQAPRRTWPFTGPLIAFLCLIAIGVGGLLAFLRIVDAGRQITDAIVTPSLPQNRRQVPIGKVRLLMNTKKVRELLGEPDDVQTMQRVGTTDEYWYYGDYQLVFEMDRLQAINRF